MEKKANRRRSVGMKTFVAMLALVLVIGCAVGGTVAWLVSSTNAVVNTFTYGDINITLELSYGLVANALDNDAAEIRCKLTNDVGNVSYSNIVTVQIQPDSTVRRAPAASPAVGTVISEAQPIGEPVIVPADVLEGSHKYVWWKCQNGHSWRARILSRSRGAGCPVCTGKAVMSGENDLATLFPDIAAQWDTERNGSLRPDQITSFSNRKVWWRCTFGHEWQAIVAARAVENSGCPYCAGRRVLAGFNDLATLHPKIAAQWDSTLNSGLTPEMVTPGSHKRVWWKCAEGHVWKTAIYSRTGKQKCGCPVCAGKATRQVKYE